MEHDRKTINGKLRAYNEGKCTLQQFVDEIEAFFEELQQLKQNCPECFGYFKNTHGNRQETIKWFIDKILGEN